MGGRATRPMAGLPIDFLSPHPHEPDRDYSSTRVSIYDLQGTMTARFSSRSWRMAAARRTRKVFSDRGSPAGPWVKARGLGRGHRDRIELSSAAVSAPEFNAEDNLNSTLKGPINRPAYPKNKEEFACRE